MSIPATRETKSPIYALAAVYICSALSFDLHFTKGILSNLLLAAALLLIVLQRYTQAKSRIAANLYRFNPTLLGPDWAYLAYIGLILLSVTWSVSTQDTIEQGAPLLVPWMAALLLSDIKAEWAAGCVIKIAIVVAVLSVLIVFVDRRVAYQPFASSGAPELRGIFDHQLYLGAFLAMSIGLILISLINGQARQVLGRFGSPLLIIWMLALLCSVAFLARARLFTAAALLALTLTWFLSKKGLRKLLTFIAFPALLIVAGMNLSKINSLLLQNGVDTTLTSRTIIWEKAVAAVRADDRLLGHGFGTFQLPHFDYLWTYFYPWRPWHAHNSFVNIYFELGLVGLILIIGLILLQLNTAWRYSVRAGRYPYSMFLIFFCVFGGMMNGRELDGFITPMFCIMLLFLAIESRSQLTPRAGSGPKVRNTIFSARQVNSGSRPTGPFSMTKRMRNPAMPDGLRRDARGRLLKPEQIETGVANEA